MTSKQESKLKMFLATGEFLEKNATITKDLPDFPPAFNEFKGVENRIKIIHEQQNSIRTGITKTKRDLRNALIKQAAEDSGKVFAFARVTGNKQLMDEVNFSISDLVHMTDVSLRSYGESLYKKIDLILDKLEKFGINQETQKKLAETIAAYNNLISKPRVGVAEKREATKELEMLFAQGDNLLDKIDAIMNIIRYKLVNFYTGYRTVRRMVSSNSGTVALKAAASDIATSKPVKGSVFTFRSNGTTIKKKTADTGVFYIKKMKPGQYELNVRKEGYKDKTLTVTVNDGERCTVRVELEQI